MTFEQAMKIKSRPKFGSKRWNIIYRAGGYGVQKCDRCGVILCNPQSILLHKGRICEKQNNTMTEETKQKLRDAGRQDLIDVYEINQSGYAGILPNGNIVDRREHTNAIPMQKNPLFNVPEPKELPQNEKI